MALVHNVQLGCWKRRLTILEYLSQRVRPTYKERKMRSAEVSGYQIVTVKRYFTVDVDEVEGRDDAEEQAKGKIDYDPEEWKIDEEVQKYGEIYIEEVNLSPGRFTATVVVSDIAAEDEDEVRDILESQLGGFEIDVTDVEEV